MLVHPLFGVAQPAVGFQPVAQQQTDPLQSAWAVRGHAGAVGQRREQQSDDPQEWSLLAASGDLPPDCRLQSGQAQPARSGQVPTITAKHDTHGRCPGRGPEWLPRGGQRRRPPALQQRRHLLDLTAGLHQQLLTTCAQMPQPAPCLIDRLGNVAAQLPGQPGDDHGIFLVGLVEGQVLATTRPRHQHRLDTHERHPSFGGQLTQHPPAMTGRFAGHRDVREALRRRLLARPVQRRPQVPRPAPKRLTRPTPSNHDR